MDRKAKSDIFELAACYIYESQLLLWRTQKLSPTDKSLWCAKATVAQNQGW